MKNYHYFVASLYDLTLDAEKSVCKIEDFVELAREVIGDGFDELKKVFIFNDIKNSLSAQKEDASYITPAYYTAEEFNKNLQEIERFLPFLSRYYSNVNSDIREYPDMNISDEVLTFFYENLDSFAKGKVKE